MRGSQFDCAMLLAARLAFGAVTKTSVLRNWLLRKWDARQPRSAFSRSMLLHCCVLRMCAETNFSHPIPDSSRCGDNQVHAPMLQPIGASVGSERKRGPQRPLNSFPIANAELMAIRLSALWAGRSLLSPWALISFGLGVSKVPGREQGYGLGRSRQQRRPHHPPRIWIKNPTTP